MAASRSPCDVTRVITIDLYDDGGGDGNNFPWLGISDDYHAVAHAGRQPSHPKEPDRTTGSSRRSR